MEYAELKIPNFATQVCIFFKKERELIKPSKVMKIKTKTELTILSLNLKSLSSIATPTQVAV